MFEPDPIWKGFTCGHSFENFVAAYPAFSLRPDIPANIQKHLEDLYALLLHSYYRYRFLDIAYTRAMQIMEMALRTRHEEFGAPELVAEKKRRRPKRTPELGDLLDWAESNGLIEETDDRPSWRKWNKKRIDVLRDLRNFAVHVDPATLHGVTIVGSLYRTVDFINELYDDVNVRKLRHKLERNIQQILTNVTTNGGILTLNGIRWIVFHAEILYAESVGDSWHLHLGCLTIFPPRPDEQGNFILPDPIFVCSCEYHVVNDTIQFTSQIDGTITLEPIKDAINQSKFQEFSAEYADNPVLWVSVIQPLADRRTQLKRYRIVC